MQGPHEVRDSTAMAATDLQHPFAAEIRLSRRAVVELNGEPVGLVQLCQRHDHRRILLVGPVEEQNVVVAKPTGEVGVKVLLTEFLAQRVETHALREGVGGNKTSSVPGRPPMSASPMG